MRTFDPTPLCRLTVGFVRLFGLFDESVRWTGEEHYPPYNVERTGHDTYQIALALAGFEPGEISIKAEQSRLIIEGRKAATADRRYLYRGISARPFRRVFSLAAYVQAKRATFEAGLFKVELVRTGPREIRPRHIADAPKEKPSAALPP